MYSCFICKTDIISLYGYFSHIRIHSNNSSFRCTINDCVRQYTNYFSFMSHLRREHIEHKVQNFHNELSGIDKVVLCPIQLCKAEFSDQKLYFLHIQKHFGDGFSIQCPIKNCTSTCCSKQSFCTHISRYHKKIRFDELLSDSNNQHTGCDRSIAMCSNIPRLSIEVDIVNNGTGSVGNMDCDESLFLRNMACFYLKLEAKFLVPVSTIKFIVEELNNMNHISTDYLMMNLKEKLYNKGLEETAISGICDEIKDTNLLKITQECGPLRTSYRRRQFYKENLNFIEPKPIHLGKRNNKDCSYYYIPVIETISAMLKNNSVKEMFNKAQATEPGIFQDYTDGYVYKNNPLFQASNSIRLILYQDAFELVNPLGSAKKLYKILAVYLVLGNMPSYCRFRTDSMQLVLLCFEKDFVYFGKDKVFARLVYDLQLLENGISFHGHFMTGSLLFMLGDNLGSHGVGGFIENFSGGKYICRFCSCTRKNWIKKKYRMSEFPLRTVASYKNDVTYLKRHPDEGERHGVKFDSPLNKLQYFHVCLPALPPCLAHDLFEGIVQWDVPLILNVLIKERKWLTLETLNKRILSFPFTDEDITNKPAAVPLKCKKLSGHAVQNWSLLRYLPLIIADKVQNDKAWSLLLLLQEIVEVICAPKIMGGQIEYLEDLINDYLMTRKKLFPQSPERPKHHYLCHYPWLIQQCGPLIHLWTLRGESKHSYFRRCMRSSQNFINPLLSLCERHQLLQSYLSTGDLYSSGIKIDKSEPFDSNLYSHSIVSAVTNCIELQSHLHDLCICFKAEVKGTLYKKNLAVIVGIGDYVMELIFGKIMFVLISKSQDVFLMVQLYSSSFNSLLRAYELQDSGNIKCCSLNSLLDYFPMTIYEVSGVKCIKLKHSIPTPMP